MVDGTTPLVFQCNEFKNPIYQARWTDFYVTTFDDEAEPFNQKIEESSSLALETWDYEPLEFADERLSIIPKVPEISELSEWTLTLSLPVPLDQYCWVKFYLPKSLKYKSEKVIGKQLFKPSYVSDVINLDDTVIDTTADADYISVVIPACKLEDYVGFSPQGTLFVDSISTPPAIKDSDRFRVEIYKDANLKYMIAKIKSGKYLSLNQLTPGQVTEISFTPRDKKVQAVGQVDIVFLAEHELSENGAVIVTFPSTMILPTPGSIVPVGANGSDGFFVATEGEVLVGNQVRISGIFAEGKVPEFPYVLDFNIGEVQNQRAASDAGEVSIRTALEYPDQEFYTVDEGSTSTSFEAESTDIKFTGKPIEISSPVTYGEDSIYRIVFTPTASVPADGFLYIEVPSQIELNESRVQSSGSCASTVNCLEVIPQQFADDPDSPGIIKVKLIDEIKADVEFVFELGGVTNPRNTARTDGFVINSFDVDDVSQIGKGQGSGVQMKDLAALSGFSGTTDRENLVNGQVNQYTFSILSEIELQPGD